MPWSVVLSVVAATGFLYWQYWKWANRRMLELAEKLPGPPPKPLLGNAFNFMLNPSEILKKLEALHMIYGQYFKVWLGPELNVSVINPADVRELLISTKVSEKGRTYESFVPFIGYGLLSGGTVWRRHRKMVTPAYNKKSVEYFTPVIDAEAEQLGRVLSQKDPEVPFDVYKDVVKFTTQCVNQTLLGFSKEESESLYRMEEVVAESRRMYALLFAKMTQWWLQIPFVYWLSGKKKQQDKYAKMIRDFGADIVRRRRKALEVSTPECLGAIDRLILSGELSEEELQTEAMAVFTTCQEAGAKIASGFLMILAHLPEWQDKVYNEIMEVVGAHGPVTNKHLKQLHYLEIVYKETLRYFSIAPVIQRTVLEEITINEGKYTIPAGTSLMIPLHILHQDPQNYDEPHKIKPERFLPENDKNRDSNSFIPYSTGPMDCIGRLYAPIMVKSIVVWALRYARLEPAVCLDDIKLDAAISMSVIGGYTIKASPRQHGHGRTVA